MQEASTTSYTVPACEKRHAATTASVRVSAPVSKLETFMNRFANHWFADWWSILQEICSQSYTNKDMQCRLDVMWLCVCVFGKGDTSGPTTWLGWRSVNRSFQITNKITRVSVFIVNPSVGTIHMGCAHQSFWRCSPLKPIAMYTNVNYVRRHNSHYVGG